MKRSKHFRKDVIITRIVFAVLCIVLGVLIGSGISALTKNSEENGASYLDREEFQFYPLFRRVAAVICNKNNKFINTTRKSISVKSLKSVPYITFSYEKKTFEPMMIDGLETSLIKRCVTNKKMFYDLLNQSDYFSIVGVDNINDTAFLEEYPDLCLLALRDQGYMEDNIVVNQTVPLSKEGKLFLDFLFDYRMVWIQDNNRYLDCTDCEKPVFD